MVRGQWWRRGTMLNASLERAESLSTWKRATLIKWLNSLPLDPEGVQEVRKVWCFCKLLDLTWEERWGKFVAVVKRWRGRIDDILVERERCHQFLRVIYEISDLILPQSYQRLYLIVAFVMLPLVHRVSDDPIRLIDWDLAKFLLRWLNRAVNLSEVQPKPIMLASSLIWRLPVVLSITWAASPLIRRGWEGIMIGIWVLREQ